MQEPTIQQLQQQLKEAQLKILHLTEELEQRPIKRKTYYYDEVDFI